MTGPDHNDELKEFISKYLTDSASLEERLFVESYFSYVEIKLQAEAVPAEETPGVYGRIREGIQREVTLQEQAQVIVLQSRRRRKVWLAAAAVVALLATGGLLWWPKNHKVPQPALAQNYYKNDVRPGGSHAVLTLANGARILLDSVGNGSLGLQGSAQVVKLGSGSLSYRGMSNGLSTVYYNKVTTPVGGQYQITLADGTHVWLNALSSLKFPTAFNGDARSVELTGEGYFEVTRNKSKPFHVYVNGVDVEVVGTHFNVNAYPDEPCIKTTLLEGAVKLVKGNANIMLSSGEQGQTNGASGLVLVKNVDVDQVVAWKNG